MNQASSKLQRLTALISGAADDPLTALRDLRTPEEIEAALLDLLARRARSSWRLSATEPLANLGLDSLELVSLVTDLERALGLRLDATFFWDYPTPRAVAARVHALRAAR